MRVQILREHNLIGVEGLCRLTVEGNGIRFGMQYAQRIFRVFERLYGRSEYPGTGIGLVICRKIAERHGGNIWADSQPGHAPFLLSRRLSSYDAP